MSSHSFRFDFLVFMHMFGTHAVDVRRRSTRHPPCVHLQLKVVHTCKYHRSSSLQKVLKGTCCVGLFASWLIGLPEPSRIAHISLQNTVSPALDGLRLMALFLLSLLLILRTWVYRIHTKNLSSDSINRFCWQLVIWMSRRHHINRHLTSACIPQFRTSDS